MQNVDSCLKTGVHLLDYFSPFWCNYIGAAMISRFCTKSNDFNKGNIVTGP